MDQPVEQPVFTLRDEIALRCLPMLVDAQTISDIFHNRISTKAVAALAYNLAQAMLDERYAHHMRDQAEVSL